MPQPYLPPLSFRIRADLHAQLATMETAGLPCDKAFALLNLPPRAQPRLLAMRKLLARGIPPARAGEKSSLFTQLEAKLLDAAYSAGSPAVVYRRLADHYTSRATQAAAIKSRLLLPVCVFLAGLCVQPLPGLVSGSLSPAAYLFHILRSLVLLAAAGYAVLHLPYWVRHGPLVFMRNTVDRILPRIPLFGAMHVRRNQRDFFESLALLVEAGMPILDALPVALDTIDNRLIKNDFARIKPAIERGATLEQAVAGLHYVVDTRVTELINTGEASGTLPEMLFRHAALDTEALNQFYQQITEWMPRLLYGLVLFWIAYGILVGPGVVPRVPEAL